MFIDINNLRDDPFIPIDTLQTSVDDSVAPARHHLLEQNMRDNFLHCTPQFTHAALDQLDAFRACGTFRFHQRLDCFLRVSVLGRCSRTIVQEI